MLVAISGHVELAKMLIGLGANLNAKDPVHGWTALMQATFYGQREVSKILLKSGADPTIAANNGCTALDLATLVEETDTSIIRLLATETVTIAPPVIAFMPISRQSSVHALKRSVSMAALPKDSSAGKKPSGLKSWWRKFSKRFRGVKKAEEVRINIIPDEPDVQSVIIPNAEDQDLEADGDGTQAAFTLGFSAATKDMPSNSSSMIVQAPSGMVSQITDQDQDQFVSRTMAVVMPDTRCLLKNFRNRLKSKSRSRTVSVDSTSCKFHSSSGSVQIKAKSRSLANDFRPRSNSLSKKPSAATGSKKPLKRRHLDVKSVLKSIKMNDYAEAFEEHEIDMAAFKELREADLVEIGVKRYSARRRIMQAIKTISIQ